MNTSGMDRKQENPVKIAILEGNSLGADMDFSPFYELGKSSFTRKLLRRKWRKESGMWISS